MRKMHRAIAGGLLALALAGCGHVHPAGPAVHGSHAGTPGGTPAYPDLPGGAPAAPGGMPGIAVFFTSAYTGLQAGESGPQVLSANAAASQANPNNPDRQLTALIDATPAGGTLDGAFFDIEVQDVVDALVRARQRGASVRLVTENDYYRDANGALRAPIQKLQAAGVPVRPDDRPGLMHDKFLVVNRQTVWTGSYNITDGGSYHDNNNAIRIDSPALAAIYEQEFAKMNGGDFGPGNHPAPQAVNVGGVQMTPYFSPNRPGEGGPKAAILAELNQARQSIKFLSYSFTDKDFGSVMAAKARAGVRVAGSFDHSQASSQYSQYRTLHGQPGVDVRISSNPALMHHKVMVIDDSVLITGSFNFSSNAQSDNDENMLVIKNAPALIAAYDGEFSRVMAASPATGLGAPVGAGESTSSRVGTTKKSRR